jgi:PAS domain S-box-containing protein
MVITRNKTINGAIEISLLPQYKEKRTMKEPAIEKFQIIRPLASALAVIVTTAALIFAIYFTERDQLWIPFLAGILIASTLAAATRVLHTEQVAMRRAERLMAIKIKLDQETKLRENAEVTVAKSKSRLILIDEVLPIMVALIDIDGRCQYYNQKFMDWLHLQPQQIRGQHLREILGIKIYREISAAIHQSLDGHSVFYERRQKMADGTIHRLLVEHLSQFDDGGNVNGFYIIINDITLHDNVETPNKLETKESDTPVDILNTGDFLHDEKTNSNMFIADPFDKKVIGHDKDTKRIMSAIENGNYCLFHQLIKPIESDSNEVKHYEALIRLKETEEILLFPEEFFPLAQMNGHMPHLDRWVVEHIIDWVSHRDAPDQESNNSMFFINISDDSINDPKFPEFLKITLQNYSVPGSTLCFEIPAVGLVLRNSEIAKFVLEVKKLDCLVALSGFSQDRVLFDLMNGIEVDFLKIEGNIICNIIHEIDDLTTVATLNMEAKKLKIKTIAERIENEETIVKLKEIGINFGQGYGISRPALLTKKLPKFHQKMKAA